MKNIAIAAVLSAFAVTPAIAAEPYIGLSVGQNKVNISTLKASTAFSIFGGYSFNEYIAAELAYANLGSADTDPATTTTVKASAASLAAVGSLPLGRDFALFAKLGYASTSVEATGSSSETKSDITYGVGAQYNLGRNIGFRLGYDNYRVGDKDTKDSALMSLAALMKF